jgi:hypothetical protein
MKSVRVESYQDLNLKPPKPHVIDVRARRFKQACRFGTGRSERRPDKQKGWRISALAFQEFQMRRETRGSLENGNFIEPKPHEAWRADNWKTLHPVG